MSDVQRNIATVGEIYAAFGRGDAPGVLARIADDVDWEPGTNADDVPWLRSGKGKATAMGFFEALGAFEVRRFDVLSIMGEGPWVVGLVRIELHAKKTGALLVEPCEPHIWRFGPDGKVASMRHAADTRQHARIARELDG